MKSNSPWFSLRTLTIVGALTSVLGACATPSAGERADYMARHYGPACAAQGLTTPKYDECVNNAYKADRQRAISQYNTDTGHTGVAALILFH